MNPKPEISFDADTHTYHIKGVDGPVRSVTEVVGDLFPFPADVIAPQVAAKTGRTVEEVLAEWQEAADKGTRTHAVAEARLNGQPRPDGLKKSEEAFYACAERTVDRVRQDLKSAGLPFSGRSEFRIADPKARVAGTTDLLLHLGGNHYLLVDWKTNKRALDSKKLEQYSLQLSLYREILLRNYLPEGSVVDIALCHFLKRGSTVDANWLFEFVKDESLDTRFLPPTAAKAAEILDTLSAKAAA